MEFNWILLLPILFLQLILQVIALFDLSKQEGMQKGHKIIWVLVILFANLLGPILYFVFGRRNQ